MLYIILDENEIKFKDDKKINDNVMMKNNKNDEKKM
jgi:hypothetical protein